MFSSSVSFAKTSFTITEFTHNQISKYEVSVESDKKYIGQFTKLEAKSGNTSLCSNFFIKIEMKTLKKKKTIFACDDLKTYPEQKEIHVFAYNLKRLIK